MRPRNTILIALMLSSPVLTAGATVFARGPLDAPVPPENPITEEKRVLGKILFWDAQLSTDNTIACGTCHIPRVSGTDPRFAVSPGPDTVYGNADDRLGSLGVIRTDADLHYGPDPVYGLGVQVTKRASNPFFLSHFAAEIFWDGAASGTFVDPESGVVSIETGGALETQSLVPILSVVEMGHAARDWDQVRDKLATARPLALATDLPGDVALRLDEEPRPSYPDLFADAFGDSAITAERIAYAIATYERTLVPDQTPWDAFVGGDPEALGPAERRGWQIFRSPQARCDQCHVPPHFTDNTFRNIGLRPWQEDPGRMDVTSDFGDRGKFKVPGLRNIIFKPTYMHNGMLDSVSRVLDFYAGAPGFERFPENRDPLVDGILMSPQERDDLNAFLRNGLIDTRVPTETFPFDRPTLHTELLDPNPAIIGAGEPGTGGAIPQMIATAPPNIGNSDFKIGVKDALGGAVAFVGVSDLPPGPDGRIEAREMLGPVVLGDAGDGDGDGGGNGNGAAGGTSGAGYGTWIEPIADDEALRGTRVYLQWFITDPAGDDGIVTSDVARLTYFLADPTECDCPTDLDCDGAVGFSDLLRVLSRWGECPDCREDMSGDGAVTLEELLVLLNAWGPGCDG